MLDFATLIASFNIFLCAIIESAEPFDLLQMNILCLPESCTSLVQVEKQHLDYMCLDCHGMAF